MTDINPSREEFPPTSTPVDLTLYGVHLRDFDQESVAAPLSPDYRPTASTYRLELLEGTLRWVEKFCVAPTGGEPAEAATLREERDDARAALARVREQADDWSSVEVLPCTLDRDRWLKIAGDNIRYLLDGQGADAAGRATTGGTHLPPLSRAEIDVLWASLLAWQAKHMNGPAMTPDERQAARNLQTILDEVRNRADTDGSDHA